jgi:predicted adenylyl cyclase CyaB
MKKNRLLQRNIELKARCDDLGRARRLALAHGARSEEILIQIDTYFHVADGRLKLREIEGQPSELIFYHRPDISNAKPSEYWLTRFDDAAELKALLSAALGIRAVVRKRRELLMWKNVRVHLDQVENLGNFIELEAVIDPENDENASRERLDELIGALMIRAEERLSGSYGEMSER